MDVITWLLIVTITRLTDALQCWNCVGRLCDQIPADSFAEKRVCQQEESCQKVVYTMVEYNSSTIFKSVVRSCSMGTCIPTGESNYSACLERDRIFRVYGCSCRTCCDDKDLCNKGAVESPNVILMVVTSVLSYSYYILSFRKCK